MEMDDSEEQRLFSLLNSFLKDLVKFYNTYLFNISSIVDSLDEFIPDKIDKKDVECVEIVNTIKKIQKLCNTIDYRHLLKYPIKRSFKQTKRIYNNREIKDKDPFDLLINYCLTVESFIMYDEIKSFILYWRLKVYVFLMGQKIKERIISIKN